MKRVLFWMTVIWTALVASLTSAPARADGPSVIRIGVPGVGTGNRPIIGGSNVAIVHLRGLLEEEFKPDKIQIKWNFLRGAGPAVNELFANGLADFGFGLGDLPSIIGHAGGLNTRVLAAGGIRQNTYLAVPADSSVKTIQDLRGKKVAIFKGTNIQLAVAKILEGSGLTEKDIRAINMDTATTKAALITKDIDAAFGGVDLLALRDQGTARIIYDTRSDPRFLRHSTLIASQDFINKYPAITKRFVKVLVQASKWMSDQEATPTPVYQLWTKSGTPFSNYKEDFIASSTIKTRASPLIDEYVTAQYKRAISDAKRFGLIKNDFSFDSWLDTSFLKQVLKEQNLEQYWQEYDATGKPKG
jgi:sulfonate transport system substrate-binding protein